MIIRSSNQVPRVTALKRFPVPRNFGMAPTSQIERGKTWPAPDGAIRVKKFEVYRYDPDSDKNPRIDTYEVDLDSCGPMVRRRADQDQERDRCHAHLSPLLPRGRLRFMFHEYRWHELAGLHTIYIEHSGAGNDLSSQSSARRQGPGA